jgi:hypothetical protein
VEAGPRLGVRLLQALDDVPEVAGERIRHVAREAVAS